MKPNHPQNTELERKLSALHDGELPPVEAACLRACLERDEELRRASEELDTLDELLGQWPTPPLADVRGAVMARVGQDLAAAPRRAMKQRWISVAWAASWMLGGVLTGLTLWTSVNRHIDEQAAVETISKDMTLSMMMTEDWTPPITIEEDSAQ